MEKGKWLALSPTSSYLYISAGFQFSSQTGNRYQYHRGIMSYGNKTTLFIAFLNR